MLAILFIFNIILENRQQVFIVKLLMKLILLITEIEYEYSRNDCADFCLLNCIHWKSAEHFRNVRCLSSSEYTTRRTISSTETQCDYLLILRVTFEAIRSDSKKSSLSVERRKEDVPKQTKAKSEEYRLSLGRLRCERRGCSYSIVTFTHSKGQHYGFASIGGSSHENFGWEKLKLFVNDS